MAGRELVDESPAAWIRPVSDRPHEEVSEYERQYEDGSDPRLLDIIDVPLKGQCAKLHQPENWLLDADRYWVKVGRLKLRELRSFVDDTLLTWPKDYSTYHGVNDYVPAEQVSQVDGSLGLIHLGNGLQLHVFAPGAAFGNPKQRVQAEFMFKGVEFRLRVTDPRIERHYIAQGEGDYVLGPSFLTVSLGDLYRGNHYKLVAAIIGGE